LITRLAQRIAAQPRFGVRNRPREIAIVRRKTAQSFQQFVVDVVEVGAMRLDPVIVDSGQQVALVKLRSSGSSVLVLRFGGAPGEIGRVERPIAGIALAQRLRAAIEV
jgi:hypothetical protein